MRAYTNSITGLWKHSETGRIYRFLGVCVIVYSETRYRSFSYNIATKNELSKLQFIETKQQFSFVAIHNNYFSIMNNHGELITLDKIDEKEWENYIERRPYKVKL